MENDRASVRGMAPPADALSFLPDLFLTRQYGTAMETNGYTVRKILKKSDICAAAAVNEWKEMFQGIAVFLFL